LARSGNTQRAAEASRHINSDGENAHVTFEVEDSIKKKKRKKKKDLRPLTGKSVAKRRVQRQLK
jgi:hypothetical protein